MRPASQDGPGQGHERFFLTALVFNLTPGGYFCLSLLPPQKNQNGNEKQTWGWVGKGGGGLAALVLLMLGRVLRKEPTKASQKGEEEVLPPQSTFPLPSISRPADGV